MYPIISYLIKEEKRQYLDSFVLKFFFFFKMFSYCLPYLSFDKFFFHCIVGFIEGKLYTIGKFNRFISWTRIDSCHIISVFVIFSIAGKIVQVIIYLDRNFLPFDSLLVLNIDDDGCFDIARSSRYLDQLYICLVIVFSCDDTLFTSIFLTNHIS